MTPNKDMAKIANGKGSDAMMKECNSKVMPEHAKAMTGTDSMKKEK